LPFFVWRISGSRSPEAFLVDEGAWRMVASTMRARLDLEALGLQMHVHRVQHQPAKIVLLQQMTEP
jgi:hypothetical protein